ncbi:hypothetical protein B0T25DRAFT_67064 [Lasiosphaeria hispida]|uniref:Uncharacterized protein n=1 Tax=Lasiosphaeria hispida TaxID=260671 RepID=A0AAJ0HXN0_9PEZI|nr:hypothetical protein B0T25DRAFT_67064 [Lasiosphaeria hispida]
MVFEYVRVFSCWELLLGGQVLTARDPANKAVSMLTGVSTICCLFSLFGTHSAGAVIRCPHTTLSQPLAFIQTQTSPQNQQLCAAPRPTTCPTHQRWAQRCMRRRQQRVLWGLKSTPASDRTYPDGFRWADGCDLAFIDPSWLEVWSSVDGGGAISCQRFLPRLSRGLSALSRAFSPERAPVNDYGSIPSPTDDIHSRYFSGDATADYLEFWAWQ